MSEQINESQLPSSLAELSLWEKILKVFFSIFGKDYLKYREKRIFINEKIASGNLIFTSWVQPVLIFLPVLFGSIGYFFIENQVQGITNSFWTELVELRNAKIDNFLLYFNATIVLLSAYFVSFRWISIRSEGKYGYWLAMGITRRKFITYLSIGFFANYIFSFILSLILIQYMSSLYLGLGKFSILILLQVAALFLMISTAILLAEIFNNPELGMFIFLLFYVTVLLFDEQGGVLHSIFAPQFYYLDADWLLRSMGILVVSIVFSIFTWRIHKYKDIDLGG